MVLNVSRLPSQIKIGYAGENDAKKIKIDFTQWAVRYGAGSLTVLMQRAGDGNPYPVVTESEGAVSTWAPSSTDTAVSGAGQIQLRYTVGGTIAKSEIVGVMVGKSLGAETDPPDPYESWLGTLTDLATETEQNAQAAAQSATEAETAASSVADSVAQAHLYATQAGNSASSASDSAVDAQRGAETAEAWAVGERDGTDVPSTDPTYHNNSKYWSDLSRQGATNNGYTQLYTDDDGALYLVRTVNITDRINFNLTAVGELEVVVHG